MLGPREFEQRLGAAPLAPLWLIASGEPLLLLEAADALRRRAREEGYGEREVFEADGRFDWDPFEASVRAPSLFSPRRLIEVRLAGGKPGKEGGAVLERYAASPAPDVLLLVTAAEWSRKHEGAWSRAFERAGVAVALWPPRAHELAAWIGRRLKSRGLDATPDAAALLAERGEGNLLALAQEIDKLALLGERGRLDADRLQTLVADSARYDVFRLAETALAGDAGRALQMLAGLRAEGEQVVPLLSWLASQVQTLASLAAVQEGGGNLGQAMSAAGVWESRQALYKRALSRGSARDFARLLDDCARLDRIGKGREEGDAWRELERLVVGIAAPRALPRRAPPCT